MTRVRAVAAVMSLVLISLALSGYRIIHPAIHEGMTRAAKSCFELAVRNGSKPVACDRDLSIRNVDVTWIEGSSRRFYDVFAWFKHVTGIESNYPDLKDAVRWPDDPTRQIFGVSVVKWVVNVGLIDCKVHARDGVIDIDAGLLCNSHLGAMQFLHAQATSAGESAADTHYRITQWAEFLYRVASGDITNEQLDAPYCDYFSNSSDIFQAAMLPSQHATPCEEENDPKWTLTTLFTMRCSDPFTSLRCREELGSSRHDKARIYATGALLHVIQDSFAQGHCVRGDCEVVNDRARAKVECLPITMFTTYRGQDKKRHTQADMEPVFADSCTPRADIDDPVTASAKALWHIRNRSSIDAFREDLYRVFGHPGTMTHVAPAGLGACFVPDDDD